MSMSMTLVGNPDKGCQLAPPSTLLNIDGSPGNTPVVARYSNRGFTGSTAILLASGTAPSRTQVAPPSVERPTAPSRDMKMRLGFDGAIAAAKRPFDVDG